MLMARHSEVWRNSKRFLCWAAGWVALFCRWCSRAGRTLLSQYHLLFQGKVFYAEAKFEETVIFCLLQRLAADILVPVWKSNCMLARFMMDEKWLQGRGKRKSRGLKREKEQLMSQSQTLLVCFGLSSKKERHSKLQSKTTIFKCLPKYFSNN